MDTFFLHFLIWAFGMWLSFVAITVEIVVFRWENEAPKEEKI